MSDVFDTREKARRARVEQLRSRIVEWAPACMRALVASVCAAALAAQVGSPFLQLTCGLMAMLGMVVGQRLGRTALRSGVLLPSLGLAALMSWWLSGLVTGSSVLVSLPAVAATRGDRTRLAVIAPTDDAAPAPQQEAFLRAVLANLTAARAGQRGPLR